MPDSRHDIRRLFEDLSSNGVNYSKDARDTAEDAGRMLNAWVDTAFAELIKRAESDIEKAQDAHKEFKTTLEKSILVMETEQKAIGEAIKVLKNSGVLNQAALQEQAEVLSKAAKAIDADYNHRIEAAKNLGSTIFNALTSAGKAFGA